MPGAWARVSHRRGGSEARRALGAAGSMTKCWWSSSTPTPAGPLVVGSLYHAPRLALDRRWYRRRAAGRTDAGTEIRIKQTENREEIRLRVHSDGPVVHIVAATPAKVSIIVEHGRLRSDRKDSATDAKEQFEIKAGKLSLEASDGVTISSQATSP